MFETPNPRARGADRYPRRKALGVALRESGAAGIFRRTEKAIQTLGMQNLLSFIQHPDTNISNPEDLPLTADELEALMISDIDLPILEALHKKGEPLRVPGGQITYRLKDLNDARRGSHTADIIRRQEQELGIKSFGPLTTKELERPLPRKFEKKAKPRSDASYRRRWSPMR